MTKLLEKHIQAQILEYLKLKGYFVWRNNTGSFKTEGGGFFRAGLTGSPDILGLTKNGTFLAIEVKRPGNVLSEPQEAFKAQIEANKGIYITAYSVDDLNEKLFTPYQHNTISQSCQNKR